MAGDQETDGKRETLQGRTPGMWDFLCLGCLTMPSRLGRYGGSVMSSGQNTNAVRRALGGPLFSDLEVQERVWVGRRGIPPFARSRDSKSFMV
jgi:hypothetical protein